MPQKNNAHNTPKILENGIVLSEIRDTRAFSFICTIKKQTITHRDSLEEGEGVDLENNDQGSLPSIGLDQNWAEEREERFQV